MCFCAPKKCREAIWWSIAEVPTIPIFCREVKALLLQLAALKLTKGSKRQPSLVHQEGLVLVRKKERINWRSWEIKLFHTFRNLQTYFLCPTYFHLFKELNFIKRKVIKNYFRSKTLSNLIKSWSFEFFNFRIKLFTCCKKCA